MEFNKENLKAFWNDLTGKAGTAAKAAAKKTGEAAETAKLAITLKTEESKLRGLYAKLGVLYYANTAGEDNADVLAAQVLEIDEQKMVIENLRAVIDERNGKMKCPNCGKIIDIESAFCNSCGAKQEQKKNVTTEEAPAEEAKAEETKAEEAPAPAAKPLTAEEFIAFFKTTIEKYFA
ncbi:MAG: zinc ribbon domain-containing protein [Ruminococcaceae bacterium]|nr:zinc ribbon domain-containing protein [Oscillospiraceae bacterium]